MQAFSPQKIYIEAAVAGLPLTRRLVEKFSHLVPQVIEDYSLLKEPQPITGAKKVLVIAAGKGEALKPFPKILHAVNLGDYVFNPISNCHLECTYCILQSYLQNNPTLTVFSNLEHFFSAIAGATRQAGTKTLRLGTGELSDSLALDDLTGLSGELVPFFSRLPNAYLELKTKSDRVAGVLGLDHRGHTVLSWSMSPRHIAAQEELKCATTDERLASARRAQAAGYPVGIHLDPLIYFSGWEAAYQELVGQLAAALDPRRIAWISVGSLRYDKNLKAVATARFPQTKIFSEDFIEAPDGKMRYFKTLRMEMYRKLWEWLMEWSPDFPRYLCMEPPWMWEAVCGEAPPAEVVEQKLVDRLRRLSV